MAHPIPLILTDGPSFDAAARDHTPTLIVLQLSRHEIERGHIGDAVDRLMVLSDSARHTRQYTGTLTLMVEGYDTDPRPLPYIPEVRDFVRRLTDEWPYWFHFIDLRGDTLGVLLGLLLDLELVQIGPDGETGSALRDPSQVGAVLKRLFGALGNLYALHNITPAVCRARAETVQLALDALWSQG